MAQAIKSYAYERFDNTIIDECQKNDLLEELLGRAEDLSILNPKWNPAEFAMRDNTCGGTFLVQTSIYWVYVNGECILTLNKANGQFIDC